MRFTSRHKRLGFSLAIVGALAALIVTAFVQAGGPPLPPIPGGGTNRADYATAVAAAQANDKPQLDFLTQFNTGSRRYDSLPVEELEADAPPPITFDASAKGAGAVAVLKVDSVIFFGSNIGSLPAMRVSYHVVKAVAGVVEGQQVVIELAGGPYHLSDGHDAFLVLPGFSRVLVGDTQMAVIDPVSGNTFSPHRAGSLFTIDASGHITPTQSAQDAGIAGQDLATVLSRAASARMAP